MATIQASFGNAAEFFNGLTTIPAIGSINATAPAGGGGRTRPLARGNRFETAHVVNR